MTYNTNTPLLNTIGLCELLKHVEVRPLGSNSARNATVPAPDKETHARDTLLNNTIT